jgi:hypothetical protein
MTAWLNAVTTACRRHGMQLTMKRVKSRYKQISGIAARIKEEGSAYAGDVESVRTTIDLDPERHRRLKVYAASQGVKIADLFRRWVDEHCA